jgi:hypothetical protein
LARAVLQVIIAAADRKMMLGPNDLHADIEAGGEQSVMMRDKQIA